MSSHQIPIQTQKISLENKIQDWFGDLPNNPLKIALLVNSFLVFLFFALFIIYYFKYKRLLRNGQKNQILYDVENQKQVNKNVIKEEQLNYELQENFLQNSPTPKSKLTPEIQPDVNNNNETVSITHHKNSRIFSNVRNYKDYNNYAKGDQINSHADLDQDQHERFSMLPNKNNNNINEKFVETQFQHQASLRTQISNLYKSPDLAKRPVISQTPKLVSTPAKGNILTAAQNFDTNTLQSNHNSNRSSSRASSYNNQNIKFKSPHPVIPNSSYQNNYGDDQFDAVAPMPKRRSFANEILNEQPNSHNSNSNPPHQLPFVSNSDGSDISNPFKVKDKIMRTPMASVKSVNKISIFRSKQSLADSNHSGSISGNQTNHAQHPLAMQRQKIQFDNELNEQLNNLKKETENSKIQKSHVNAKNAKTKTSKMQEHKRKSDSWFLDLNENKPKIIKDMKVSLNPPRKLQIGDDKSGHSPYSMGFTSYDQLENRPVMKYEK